MNFNLGGRWGYSGGKVSWARKKPPGGSGLLAGVFVYNEMDRAEHGESAQGEERQWAYLRSIYNHHRSSA
jgi:hypothetical protein